MYITKQIFVYLAKFDRFKNLIMGILNSNDAELEIIAIWRGHNDGFIKFINQLIEIITKLSTSKITIVGDLHINSRNDF